MALLSENVCAPSVLIGEPVPKAAVVLSPPLARALESCVPAPRSTSAKRTRNRICGSSGGISTRSKFTTFPIVEAIATTRSPTAMVFTVPRIKTISFAIVSSTFASGNSLAI